MRFVVLLLCLCAASHVMSFSNYWGRRRKWQTLEQKLSSLRDAADVNNKDPNFDRIWLKRNSFKWSPEWRMRDRIWLKRRSEKPTHSDPLNMDETLTSEKQKRVPSNNEINGDSFLNIRENLGDILNNEDAEIEKFQEPEMVDNEADASGGMRYDVTLDSKGKLQLFWDIDPITETVSFRLLAKVVRSDLVAFGFSSYGQVQNADFVVLWTNQHGKHMFQDAHTDENGILHIDQSQDYVLDDVMLTSDDFTLSFHRTYDTCDDDDYMIDTGTTHIVFFTLPGLERQINGLNVTDADVGMQRVQLLKSQLPDPSFPDDTYTFVMNVQNVPVPSVETTYWCALRKLPPMPKKRHVIRFEGAITEESVGVVHHLEVFHCEVPVGTKLREYDAPCHDKSERPMGLEACRKVIGAWAMGADGLTYPAEAGYPLGGPGFSSYVMMEVHYNNPDHKAGLIDSSGIRFYVTPSLRQYDAGTMELGMEYTDKYAIPPNQDRFQLHGYCIPDCTKTALPPQGITVFGSQLHTHQTGKQVFTRHFRDGIELPELNKDVHYSPHYQQIRTLQRPVTVLPGDSLVTTCVDSTAGKNTVVMGGFAISDEMCVNYIHYYPKVELEVCKSSVNTNALYGFFNFLHEYQHEPTSPMLGIVDNFKSVDWSPLNVELLKTFMNTAPLSMQCNQSDGSRFPGDWENKAIPEILYELPPEERPCLT